MLFPLAWQAFREWWIWKSVTVRIFYYVDKYSLKLICIFKRGCCSHGGVLNYRKIEMSKLLYIKGAQAFLD
jgi:hypothetical protein